MISFAGVGTLEIDQTVSGTMSFTTPVVNIMAGDTVDLTGLAFAPGATASFNSATNLLTVTSGNAIFTLTLASPGITNFSAVKDGSGGTKVEGAIIGSNGKSAVLDGSVGNVTLTAGNGQGDVLIGGPGDTLNGATSGKDTFVFAGDFGQNIINNFISKGEWNYDVIQLDKSEFANLAAVQAATHQVGSNTVITDPHNSADTITLTGVSVSSLHFDAQHFLLA